MAGFKDGGEQRHGESHYRCAVMWHPLRQLIARPLAAGMEAGASELATELEKGIGQVAYHLRVLAGRGVLTVIPKCNPAPPRYRWSPDARWAREMIGEEEEQDS